MPPTPAQGLGQGLMPFLDSTPSLQAELGPTGSCLERAPVPSQPALNSSPADFRAGWSLRLIPWGPRGLPSSEPLARGAKWGPMNYSETPDTQPERGAVCEGLTCRPPSPGRGPLRPPLISTPAGSGPELSAGRGRPPAGQQLEGSCPHSRKWQWLKGVSAGGGHLREGGSYLREDGVTSERRGRHLREEGAPQRDGGHLREEGAPQRDGGTSGRRGHLGEEGGTSGKRGGTSGHFRQQGGGLPWNCPVRPAPSPPLNTLAPGARSRPWRPPGRGTGRGGTRCPAQSLRDTGQGVRELEPAAQTGPSHLGLGVCPSARPEAQRGWGPRKEPLGDGCRDLWVPRPWGSGQFCLAPGGGRQGWEKPGSPAGRGWRPPGERPCALADP